MNDSLEKLMFEELRNACRGGGHHSQFNPLKSSPQVCLTSPVSYSFIFLLSSGVGGFLPAMKQIGNVAALPGIIHVSVHMKIRLKIIIGLLDILFLSERKC